MLFKLVPSLVAWLRSASHGHPSINSLFLLTRTCTVAAVYQAINAKEVREFTNIADFCDPQKRMSFKVKNIIALKIDSTLQLIKLKSA